MSKYNLAAHRAVPPTFPLRATHSPIPIRFSDYTFDANWFHQLGIRDSLPVKFSFEDEPRSLDLGTAKETYKDYIYLKAAYE